MNTLKDRIGRLIASSGPISVSDYMAMCLFDPEAGYYSTREPFGTQGDFITAPEISQMFGELLAVWALSAWEANGRPVPTMLAEIGPGRGTLMADMLRTMNQLDPAFVILSRVALIETSPRLAEIQRAKLASGKAKPTWYTDVDSLPSVPLIIIGNELFDAVPVRQFVRTEAGWRERMVTLGEDGELGFAVGMAGLDPAVLPPFAQEAPLGTIFEAAPARTAIMDAIAARVASHGGAALFIDYGHLEPGTGDTLQAMRGHDYAGVFDEPGKADLTSHVDFASLADTARGHGLDVHLSTQGEFLVGMGLLQRAGALGANADDAVQTRLRSEVERLAGPDQMGTLFKVMAVTRKGVALPPFDATD
ncbi:class I SAM-dependent methyltransferase [Mesorhizobium sp. CAU 1741]|uniref:class I SAM-dependent methyltransferase n=1 Tax=Mesorhizobium sp. CAU 1741 TaxID=3140366 RepID=UPI00325B23C2